MEHIRSEKIHSYIEGVLKRDEAVAIEGHFASCDDCFKVFSGLKEMCGIMRLGFTKALASKDCPDDWVVAALIKGELAGKGAAKEHIKSCNFCLDRAAAYHKASEAENLAFKVPETWVSKAVDMMHGEVQKEVCVEKNEFLEGVFDSIRNFSKSLPSLPGYALAAVMAALLIWAAMPESTRVITISSTEKLAFKDSGAPSSLGFMGRERVEKYAGMEISKKGGNLEFGWKELPGVGEYTVAIMKKADGEEIVSGLKTSITRVSVPSDMVNKDELYGWVIGGTTSKGESFKYTGEFIVTK
ncbi:MAG: hypothetical protein A3K22_06210 [Deltaproteobacteria bacterium RBG_16_42_7]|nr:MAG: hypothetical protein A3K22_06210 [Deltaproteobacteria bacterium RBG_16_42_7]